jgi:hypothetical protein
MAAHHRKTRHDAQKPRLADLHQSGGCAFNAMWTLASESPVAKRAIPGIGSAHDKPTHGLSKTPVLQRFGIGQQEFLMNIKLTLGDCIFDKPVM